MVGTDDLNGLGRERLSPSSRGVTTTRNAGTSLTRGLSLGVQFQKLLQVELGLLQDLNLVHADVLQGEDALGRLFNLLTNRVRDQLGDDFLQVTAVNLAGHDLKHLLANRANMAGLSVGSLANLLWATLGEANTEGTEQVSVSGLDVNVSLNQSLPLLHHRAKLIRGKAHAVEVGQASLSLDFVYAKAELAEGLVLALGVQIPKGDIQDAPTEGIIGVLQALGAVDEGLPQVTDGEAGGGLNVVPVLAGERIDDLLLQSLLSLGKTLVLANSLNKMC